MLIKHLAIIGVGLIGGSLALALRKAGQVAKITGYGRSQANLERAVELGIIDDYFQDPGKAVADADMIFLAVPMGAMYEVFTKIKDHLADHAVITDGGSVKGSVITDCKRAFGQIPPNFVPGHPIAGKEQSGVEAALDDLYLNRRVILTPVVQTAETAIARVQAMWRHTGAEVNRMLPADHDRVLAATSHLPHMLAYTLVDLLSRMDDEDDIFKYAAGGFRDFTRIASSNPEMWRDICLANREQLVNMVEAFSEEIAMLGKVIRNNDAEKLNSIFTHAKKERDRYAGGIISSN